MKIGLIDNDLVERYNHMTLTKQSLRTFLDERPALSERKLALDAGLNECAIYQMYNAKDLPMTKRCKEKLLNVLPKYGWCNLE